MGFYSVFGRTFSSVVPALSQFAYLFRDEFITAESAPLASPRTCEPGPGTFTITDTGNKLSIASGYLQITTTPTGANDPQIVGSLLPYTSRSGFAFRAGVNYPAFASSRNFLGFSSANGTLSSSNMIGFFSNATGPQLMVLASGNSMAVYPITTNTLYSVCCVLRSSAGFFLIVDNKLVFVDLVSTVAPNYGGWYNGGANANNHIKIDSFRAAQLGSPWNSDWGIATDYTASPSSGATLNQEADSLTGVSWTASTGATFELSIRRTDDDNRWIVRCDQAGSTIKLIERNAGVETERSSAAQTWTNGGTFRIAAVADTQTITTNVNYVAKNSYTSASFNQTETGAKITATAGSLANFVTWPRNITGSALTELNKL